MRRILTQHASHAVEEHQIGVGMSNLSSGGVANAHVDHGVSNRVPATVRQCAGETAIRTPKIAPIRLNAMMNRYSRPLG